MDLEKIRVDPVAVDEGRWIPLDGETRVKLARLNNSKYRSAMIKLYRELDTKEPTQEQTFSILTEVMAETIILDWEGLLLEGEEVPYSKEKVIEIFSDKSLQAFADMITEAASDIENFRVLKMEEDLGKLPASSNGS